MLNALSSLPEYKERYCHISEISTCLLKYALQIKFYIRCRFITVDDGGQEPFDVGEMEDCENLQEVSTVIHVPQEAL